MCNNVDNIKPCSSVFLPSQESAQEITRRLAVARGEGRGLVLHADMWFNLQSDPHYTLCVPESVQWQILHASTLFTDPQSDKVNGEFYFAHLNEHEFALLYRILNSYQLCTEQEGHRFPALRMCTAQMERYLIQKCTKDAGALADVWINAFEKIGDSSLNGIISRARSNVSISKKSSEIIQKQEKNPEQDGIGESLSSPLPKTDSKKEDGASKPLLGPIKERSQSGEAAIVSAPQVSPRRFLLAQLTEDQRLAGMGMIGQFGRFPPHYSSWFREHAREFHSERGLHWSDEMMQRFFEEGLLKFYMGEELLLHSKDPHSMLIDCSYNYSQMTSKEDVRLYFRAYERRLFRMCAKKLGLQSAEKWTDEELVDRVRPSAEVVKRLINTLWRKEALPQGLMRLGGGLSKRQNVRQKSWPTNCGTSTRARCKKKKLFSRSCWRKTVVQS